MSVLQILAHAKPAQQKDPKPEHQPDMTTAPDQSPAAIPWPQSATAPLDVMEAWKRDIRATIVARAEKLTDMPAGTQRVRFRIGPAGEITSARTVAPVENVVLADKLIAFLDSTDFVTKPPLDKVTWVEVTFRL